MKYGESGSLESNRLNTHNSTILGSDEGTDEGSLNWWYKNKIADLGFDNYISETAIYCNNRAVDSNSTYSLSETFSYNAWNRLVGKKRPSFKCGVNSSGGVMEGKQNTADKFSTSNASGGNGQLKYPIGLMTADEVFYAAGDVYSYSNTKVYYYQNSALGAVIGDNNSWLISPGGWNGSNSWNFNVIASGRMVGSDAGVLRAVRPVISLKSCVKIKRYK